MRRWVHEAEQAYREEPTVDHIADRLLDTVANEAPNSLDAKTREKVETLNGIHSNAAGLHLYLSRRAEGRPPE